MWDPTWDTCIWHVMPREMPLSDVWSHERCLYLTWDPIWYTCIPDICQLRHPQRGCTFFKLVYFFPQGTRKGVLWAKFLQTKFANQNTKYTNQNTKNANQNNTYANQNLKYTNQNAKYATKTPSTPNVPTKTPSMPIKTSNTPTKTPSTPTKTPSTPIKTPTGKWNINFIEFYSPILIYAVLSRSNFCREFTHFFGGLFTGLKNALVYKKWQISGMDGWKNGWMDGGIEHLWC